MVQGDTALFWIIGTRVFSNRLQLKFDIIVTSFCLVYVKSYAHFFREVFMCFLHCFWYCCYWILFFYYHESNYWYRRHKKQQEQKAKKVSMLARFSRSLANNPTIVSEMINKQILNICGGIVKYQIQTFKTIVQSLWGAKKEEVLVLFMRVSCDKVWDC